MAKQEKNNIKQSFPILGMSCAACAGSAQNIIQKQKGVIEADVNFATGDLTVQYAKNETSPKQLQEALQSAGFDLLIENLDDQQEQLDTLHTNKLNQLKNKVVWAIVLSLPIVIIGMLYMNMPYANLIMFILSTPIVFGLGKDFFIGAYKQAKNKTTNMDTLVALSTGISYFFSVFNMLFENYLKQKNVHPHVYFEAAAVIITFILIGKFLEEKAKGNTSTALKKLIGLQPKNVTLILENQQEQIVAIDQIQKGNQIIVKPGEKIAVDGIVTKGNSYVDESMLSGEPSPVYKNEGKKVFAGTINQKGSLQFEAVKVGKDTLLAQIIRMVKDAQGSKAPVQKLVDKIAQIFVPIVIIISIITFLSWYFFGGEQATLQAIMAAVTVLVIACPCALGLATPTAIMVGIGKGAEKGILIKNAESLELAKKIDIIILDKTGTITYGNPEVNEIIWDKYDKLEEKILFSIEKKSEHPLADAIVKHLQDTEHIDVTLFESLTGKGAKGNVNNQTYFIGNQNLLNENNIQISEKLNNQSKIWLDQNKTVIWFANQNEALAIVSISDQIKPTSKKAINELQQMGITVFMLTGDNKQTAKATADEVGIKEYKAEMLPQDKANFVKDLKLKGKIVAMVGDGINDSTAMATADVSIAMGKGSDIAMEVAEMTIISSDLTKIKEAINLSKNTITTIKQNLFWAFIYNLIGIPIAAGILYPINGFLLNPMLAGAAMALSSVSVVTNSLRLKWKK